MQTRPLQPQEEQSSVSPSPVPPQSANGHGALSGSSGGKEENQLREIIDTIPALAWSAQPDGAAEFFNQPWLDYAGLSVQEARGWGWTAAVHADDLDRLTEYWQSIVAAGEQGEIEARLRRSDGEYRWFLFRANPFRDESGNIVKWYGTNTDIEDRKRAEDALRASERKSRLIVDSIPGFVCTLTANGEVEVLNRQISEYFGKTTEELKNWAVGDAVHPDDLPRAIDSWKRAVETGQPYALELRHRRADGAYRWFQARALPARDTEGRITGWYMLLTDIDDRKRGEDALRATERDLRLIFDSIPGFVWTMTAAGEVELVNPQMLAYFGRTLDELKDWALFVHPDDRERVVALWKSTKEAGQPYDVEHRLRRADGAYRWFQVRGLPQRDAEGHVLRWYNLVTDIDERKKAEEKLRRSEWHLLEAQRLGRSGSWSFDVASGLVTATPEMIRLVGVEPSEGPEAWNAKMHPEDRKRHQELRKQCFTEKVNYEADYRMLLSDGTIKHMRSIGYPVLNNAGDLVEFLGTTIDITEQVEARTALENALTEVKLLRDHLYQENLVLKEEIDQASMFEEIVGSSEPLQRVLVHVAKVAPTDSTALIFGETGTGKELIARAIHKRSRRSESPFIRVNCSAIPQSLIASELFGHERGAFTGAIERRIGRFEAANRGTLFLDEVGELPMETQLTLLRVLQERELERVGSSRPIPIDVRVVAATNRDLEAALADGTFRRDLFYRLNVFPIHIPPLRERADDIPMLVEYLIERYAKKAGKKFDCIRRTTQEQLQAYDWPGNIRELQNVIERTVVLSDGGTFAIDDTWLKRKAPSLQGPSIPLHAKLTEREKEMIETALRESRGKVSGPFGAAEKLGIPRQTLDSRILSLKIDKRQFKRSTN
jgi:PAS domain S-box-containing protein